MWDILVFFCLCFVFVSLLGAYNLTRIGDGLKKLYQLNQSLLSEQVLHFKDACNSLTSSVMFFPFRKHGRNKAAQP